MLKADKHHKRIYLFQQFECMGDLSGKHASSSRVFSRMPSFFTEHCAACYPKSAINTVTHTARQEWLSAKLFPGNDSVFEAETYEQWKVMSEGPHFPQGSGTSCFRSVHLCQMLSIISGLSQKLIATAATFSPH